MIYIIISSCNNEVCPTFKYAWDHGWERYMALGHLYDKPRLYINIPTRKPHWDFCKASRIYKTYIFNLQVDLSLYPLIQQLFKLARVVLMTAPWSSSHYNVPAASWLWPEPLGSRSQLRHCSIPRSCFHHWWSSLPASLKQIQSGSQEDIAKGQIWDVLA